MGYTTKRKLKKKYQDLELAAELLSFSTTLMMNSYKSRIKKLEADVKKLRDSKNVDWNRYEDELKIRGRHRNQPSDPRW